MELQVHWNMASPGMLFAGDVCGDGSCADILKGDPELRRGGFGLIQCAVLNFRDVELTAQCYGALLGRIQDSALSEAFVFYV